MSQNKLMKEFCKTRDRWTDFCNKRKSPGEYPEDSFCIRDGPGAGTKIDVEYYLDRLWDLAMGATPFSRKKKKPLYTSAERMWKQRQ